MNMILMCGLWCDIEGYKQSLQAD